MECSPQLPLWGVLTGSFASRILGLALSCGFPRPPMECFLVGFITFIKHTTSWGSCFAFVTHSIRGAPTSKTAAACGAEAKAIWLIWLPAGRFFTEKRLSGHGSKRKSLKHRRCFLFFHFSFYLLPNRILLYPIFDPQPTNTNSGLWDRSPAGTRLGTYLRQTDFPFRRLAKSSKTLRKTTVGRVPLVRPEEKSRFLESQKQLVFTKLSKKSFQRAHWASRVPVTLDAHET